MPRGKWRGLGRGLQGAGQGLMGIAGLMADLDKKEEASAARKEANFSKYADSTEMSRMVSQGETLESMTLKWEAAADRNALTPDHVVELRRAWRESAPDLARQRVSGILGEFVQQYDPVKQTIQSAEPSLKHALQVAYPKADIPELYDYAKTRSPQWWADQARGAGTLQPFDPDEPRISATVEESLIDQSRMPSYRTPRDLAIAGGITDVLADLESIERESSAQSARDAAANIVNSPENGYRKILGADEETEYLFTPSKINQLRAQTPGASADSNDAQVRLVAAMKKEARAGSHFAVPYDQGIQTIAEGLYEDKTGRAMDDIGEYGSLRSRYAEDERWGLETTPSPVAPQVAEEDTEGFMIAELRKQHGLDEHGNELWPTRITDKQRWALIYGSEVPFNESQNSAINTATVRHQDTLRKETDQIRSKRMDSLLPPYRVEKEGQASGDEAAQLVQRTTGLATEWGIDMSNLTAGAFTEAVLDTESLRYHRDSYITALSEGTYGVAITDTKVLQRLGNLFAQQEFLALPTANQNAIAEIYAQTLDRGDLPGSHILEGLFQGVLGYSPAKWAPDLEREFQSITNSINSSTQTLSSSIFENLTSDDKKSLKAELKNLNNYLPSDQQLRTVGMFGRGDEIVQRGLEGGVYTGVPEYDARVPVADPWARERGRFKVFNTNTGVELSTDDLQALANDSAAKMKEDYMEGYADQPRWIRAALWQKSVTDTSPRDRRDPRVETPGRWDLHRTHAGGPEGSYTPPPGKTERARDGNRAFYRPTKMELYNLKGEWEQAGRPGVPEDVWGARTRMRRIVDNYHDETHTPIDTLPPDEQAKEREIRSARALYKRNEITQEQLLEVYRKYEDPSMEHRHEGGPHLPSGSYGVPGTGQHAQPQGLPQSAPGPFGLPVYPLAPGGGQAPPLFQPLSRSPGAVGSTRPQPAPALSRQWQVPPPAPEAEFDVGLPQVNQYQPFRPPVYPLAPGQVPPPAPLPTPAPPQVSAIPDAYEWEGGVTEPEVEFDVGMPDPEFQRKWLLRGKQIWQQRGIIPVVPGYEDFETELQPDTDFDVGLPVSGPPHIQRQYVPPVSTPRTFRAQAPLPGPQALPLQTGLYSVDDWRSQLKLPVPETEFDVGMPHSWITKGVGPGGVPAGTEETIPYYIPGPGITSTRRRVMPHKPPQQGFFTSPLPQQPAGSQISYEQGNFSKLGNGKGQVSYELLLKTWEQTDPDLFSKVEKNPDIDFTGHVMKIINNISVRYGLPPVIVATVVGKETSWIQGYGDYKDWIAGEDTDEPAYGIMQVKEQTAKEEIESGRTKLWNESMTPYGLKFSDSQGGDPRQMTWDQFLLHGDNPASGSAGYDWTDPSHNIEVGTSRIRSSMSILARSFPDLQDPVNHEHLMALTLAGYNAGPNAIVTSINKFHGGSWEKFLESTSYAGAQSYGQGAVASASYGSYNE